VKVPPIGIGPDQNLRQQRTQSVNRDITGAGLANGHEGLVPFIQASVGDGNHQSGQGQWKRQPERPPRIPWKTVMLNKPNSVTVCHFADPHMHKA